MQSKNNSQSKVQQGDKSANISYLQEYYKLENVYKGMILQGL